DGITSLSVRPLRLITWLGFFISIASFIAVIVIVIQYFLGMTVTGWSSTTCAIFFMGGVQLLCLGVLGEYIGKIYNESKGRPRYIVAEKTFEDGGGEEHVD
ncbi:MAG: glycosyltransferase, partial [Oscillospiraceae bacterium]